MHLSSSFCIGDLPKAVASHVRSHESPLRKEKKGRHDASTGIVSRLEPWLVVRAQARPRCRYTGFTVQKILITHSLSCCLRIIIAIPSERPFPDPSAVQPRFELAPPPTHISARRRRIFGNIGATIRRASFVSVRGGGHSGALERGSLSTRTPAPVVCPFII